jgi:hypothetical protein
MTSIVVSALIAIAAWFALNFFGRPILAIRESRLVALQIGERYSGVGFGSSDGLRDTALKAYNDIGNTLLAYSRERSLATRIWCYLFSYDLEVAARCLFALAEGPRGEFSINDDRRKNTLNALFISLGVKHHLSATELMAVKQMIAEAKKAANPVTR